MRFLHVRPALEMVQSHIWTNIEYDRFMSMSGCTVIKPNLSDKYETVVAKPGSFFGSVIDDTVKYCKKYGVNGAVFEFNGSVTTVENPEWKSFNILEKIAGSK